MEEGFDSGKYRELVLREVEARAKGFKRFYLEVGGKLLFDGHASRVLPGYEPENKIKIIKWLNNSGLLYCVNANDLNSKKRLTKKKVDYFKQCKKELEAFEKRKIPIEAVVLTRYKGDIGKKKKKKPKKIRKFLKYLKKKKIHCEIFGEFEGYTKDPKNAIASYKENKHIPVKKRIIIVTGPAGNSGKMAVTMSQLYHEVRKGWKVNYAKLETFPVWDLALDNPINLAYEAATADLRDKNKLDGLHWRHYHKRATSYNRDLDNFKILGKVSRKKFPFGYKSTTDMGINKISNCIENEKICEAAALKEIIQRYERFKEEVKKDREDPQTIDRMREIARKVE